MEIKYKQCGDYLIPDLELREQRKIGHYGRLRKAYLEDHRPALFAELVLSERLYDHCAEIEDTVKICLKYGTPCDITLKDISTVGYRPQNLIVWAEAASDVLDRYYGEA